VHYLVVHLAVQKVVWMAVQLELLKVVCSVDPMVAHLVAQMDATTVVWMAVHLELPMVDCSVEHLEPSKAVN
jgi:hypothetical protein